MGLRRYGELRPAVLHQRDRAVDDTGCGRTVLRTSNDRQAFLRRHQRICTLFFVQPQHCFERQNAQYRFIQPFLRQLAGLQPLPHEPQILVMVAIV